MLSNDQRGWIMASVSGVACVLGSSIISIDYIVRLFPGKKNFKIEESNAFLSASLSLSFGVMLFASLYSMLPSADRYLTESGLAPKTAAWTLIICFLGGVVGIQILSRVIHSYIPSEVVDCSHTHDEHPRYNNEEEEPHAAPNAPLVSGFPRGSDARTDSGSGDRAMEGTPLLSHENDAGGIETDLPSAMKERPSIPRRRPSFPSRVKTQMSSLVYGDHGACESGPCYGYTNPCGRECLKYLPPKASDGDPWRQPKDGRKLQVHRSSTTPLLRPMRTGGLQNVDEEAGVAGDALAPVPSSLQAPGSIVSRPSEDDFDKYASGLTAGNGSIESGGKSIQGFKDANSRGKSMHHHHVPTNAFLSIGLQTSLAIALHKLPEGFITYATNHANSQLGFSVFMALFIHNITEGFAMAMPLFLALGSRTKAILWSSLLGGFSQPLGAGVAALWFALAGQNDMAPGERVYGAMFAITSGIMASVALQLFSQGLDLCHKQGICTLFAFLGMALLGVSFALTAS